MLSERGLRDGRTLAVAHARPQEAAEVVAYVEGVSAESDFLTFGPGEFGIPVDDEVRFIAGLEGGQTGFMLLGRVGGVLASTCTVMRGRRARLNHIGEFGITVARSHWGLGVGRGMCEAMLREARRVGITKVDLKVREDNARAIRLYESVGFVREGLAARELRVGDRYFADVLMGICLD